MDYRHAENMVIIVLKELYRDFSSLSPEKKKEVREIGKLFQRPEVLRTAMFDHNGSKKEKADLLNSYFVANSVYQSLKDFCSKKLHAHNFVMILRRLKTEVEESFKRFYKGQPLCLPKAKRLDSVNRYSVPVDPGKYSFKGKSKKYIGINLGKSEDFKKGMKYFFAGNSEYFDDKPIESLNVSVSNGSVYLNFRYDSKAYQGFQSLGKLFKKEESTVTRTSKLTTPKSIPKPSFVGLDLGVVNLVSLVFKDSSQESIIFKDQGLVRKNEEFNRVIGDLSSKLSLTSKESDRVFYNELKSKRSYFLEKRNRFMKDYFEKLSCRILEVVSTSGANHLVVSKNLGKMKEKGSFKSGIKFEKRRFYQIPRIKLIDKIIEKAPKFGIVVEEVNEAFTSKASSLSEDIKVIKSNKPKDPTELNGVRGSKGSVLSRGLFHDLKLGKIINSDLNGALNHIFLSQHCNFQEGASLLPKLQSARKIKCISEFHRYAVNNGVSQFVGSVRNGLKPSAVIHERTLPLAPVLV
jgi:IS605 OrfB family transposase